MMVYDQHTGLTIWRSGFEFWLRHDTKVLNTLGLGIHSTGASDKQVVNPTGGQSLGKSSKAPALSAGSLNICATKTSMGRPGSLMVDLVIC